MTKPLSKLNAERRRSFQDAERRGCTALVKSTGKPCRASSMASEPYCHFHGKKNKLAQEAARLKAGLMSARRGAPPNYAELDLSDAKKIRRVLEETLLAVSRGGCPPSVANSITAMLRVAASLTELELLSRVADVEAKLEAREK
jgi:hypothetical protein